MSVPADIHPRKRRTRLMLRIENNQILDLMRAGATNDFIRERLKLSDYNFKKRIAALQREDYGRVLESQSIEARAQLLENCKRKIQALEIFANDILVDPRSGFLHKLAAMDRLRQYALDLAKLSSEGPGIFRVLNNGLYRGSDIPAIAADSDNGDRASELVDKNRVA